MRERSAGASALDASFRGVKDEVRKTISAATPTHLHLRQRIVWILGATFAVALVGSVAIYFLERDASGTHIDTFGDSLFWTSCQLLTVSSQLPNPLSTGGRILDVFLELWAISVVASLAGSFGAFFHRRGMETHPPPWIRSQQQGDQQH
jgi:hypothetical protein